MKRSELIFGAVLVPIDFMAIMLAGASAYFLRTHEYVQSVRPAMFILDLPFFSYMQLVAIVSAVIVIIFALQGLYAMQATRRLVDELTRIFSGISMGIMGVIIYIFLSAELFQSRFILLAAYMLAMMFVSLGRWGVHKIQVEALARGIGEYRVVLVGNGKYAKQLARLFKKRKYLSYRVVGEPDIVRWEILEDIRKKYGIDEVFKTDPTVPEEDNLVLLDFCDKYKIGYKYIPDLFGTYAAHIRFREIGGLPIMELLRTPLDGWGRVVKRIMDLIGAIGGLVILSPLFLIVVIAIKMDTKGSVFYTQTRVGRNMSRFDIYKFRSMEIEYCTGSKYGGDEATSFERRLRARLNERSGPLFKMKNDPRVTKVGRVLRRTRIDELPQLINVLKGEMSLIGPRPHLPEEVEKYDKHHRKLFTIKPGMSGMAQVNGSAGLAFEQEAKLDISYIEDWSLWLDIVLLIKTFKILFTDRNAV